MQVNIKLSQRLKTNTCLLNWSRKGRRYTEKSKRFRR